MKCVILAAGYATRLNPLTENFPKPLLPVGGKPILDWLISDLSGSINEFRVVTNHKFAEQFRTWAEGHKERITVIDDGTESNETRLGAVRDIQLAATGIEDDVLVMAGDNVLTFSLIPFIQYAQEKGTSCVMSHPEERLEALQRTAVITTDDGGLITSYAVYDNGDRKTVLWVPDCGSATYHFTKLRDNEKQYQVEKDTVGQDVFGPAPWYIAVVVAGENNIERNLAHPKSVGTMSDTGEEEGYEVKPAHRWIGGSHFDNPEEAYIKKEKAEETLKAMSLERQEACQLYFYKGYNMTEISRKLGISVAAVHYRIFGKKKMGRKA